MNGEVLVEQTGRRSAGDSEAKSLQDSLRPSPSFGRTLFAPSAGHSATRPVGYIALKRWPATCTADVTNSFFHVDEAEVRG